MSSFRVTVGNATTRVKTFRDARSVVASAITDLLAGDPEAVSRDAMAVNEAFASGAAEHMLIAHGRWGTTITLDGEPVPLAIVRKRW